MFEFLLGLLGSNDEILIVRGLALLIAVIAVCVLYFLFRKRRTRCRWGVLGIIVGVGAMWFAQSYYVEWVIKQPVSAASACSDLGAICGNPLTAGEMEQYEHDLNEIIRISRKFGDTVKDLDGVRSSDAWKVASFAGPLSGVEEILEMIRIYRPQADKLEAYTKSVSELRLQYAQCVDNLKTEPSEKSVYELYGAIHEMRVELIKQYIVLQWFRDETEALASNIDSIYTGLKLIPGIGESLAGILGDARTWSRDLDGIVKNSMAQADAEYSTIEQLLLYLRTHRINP